MDFGDLMRLFDYWSYQPPVHVAVARYLGYTKPRRIEASDVAKMIRAVTPKSRGRAKPLDRAPLWIQQMAADQKKRKREKRA
jgi:hypothetical protein